MKENLKILVKNTDEAKEARQLLHGLGGGIFTGNSCEVLYFADARLHKFKTISFDELRELAREKEYLNDKFKLVVTNQPLDGWRLVPDGAEYFTAFDNAYMFWKTTDHLNLCHPMSSESWIRGDMNMGEYIQYWKGTKILWQRENKVETAKGRFLHQEWYEAFGRGKDLLLKMINNKSTVLQVNSAMGLHIFDDANNHFSLKPKTIQIGSRTINAPISVKPDIGTFYYVPKLDEPEKCVEYIWADNCLHDLRFDNNLCHLTTDDAISHTEALLELMK